MRIIEVSNQGGEIIRDEVYPFACQCGESHKTAQKAWDCKRCVRLLIPLRQYDDRSIYHFTGDREPTTGELESLEHDPFLSDAEADGDALSSAGMGTDEDYGFFGYDDDEY